MALFSPKLAIAASLFVSVFFCSSSSFQDCGRRGKTKWVIGGRNAEHGEFPWMVSLQFSMWGATAHVCGGSLIHPEWVVTAAHCFDKSKDPRKFSVRVGEWRLKYDDGTERDYAVSKIIRHEYWNSPNKYQNDIAVIKLAKPVDMTSPYAGTICLPVESKDYRGQNCTLTGWGYTKYHPIWGGTKANYLQKVTGPIWNQTALEEVWQDILQPGMLGFGFDGRSYGDCAGDSGGPLICHDDEDDAYHLAGVVSWGTTLCSFRPGVLSDVAYFRKWIDEHAR